jgi:hypothetical protein
MQPVVARVFIDFHRQRSPNRSKPTYNRYTPGLERRLPTPFCASDTEETVARLLSPLIARAMYDFPVKMVNGSLWQKVAAQTIKMCKKQFEYPYLDNSDTVFG